MLQFAQPGKRRGLFGSPSKGIMPGVQLMPGGNPGDMTPAPKKGGFFGEGGIGRGIAGTLGDFLLQQADMAPVYAPTMQLRQQAEQEAAQYQRQREDKWSDWQRQYDYERNNPKPGASQPYRTEDNAGNVWELGADGQFKPIFTDPNDKVYMQDGQMITVPNRVRAGQMGQVAPAAPAMNMPQVSDEASYNAVPPGAQYRTPDGKVRVKGGAAAPASRPFVEAPRGFVPPMRLPGGMMTSGRRTPEGNAAVGGVPNSAHLRGEAVDYDGADLNALLAQARKLPGVTKAFIHNGHVHTEGKGWSAPYYGKNGTKGLKR